MIASWLRRLNLLDCCHSHCFLSGSLKRLLAPHTRAEALRGRLRPLNSSSPRFDASLPVARVHVPGEARVSLCALEMHVVRLGFERGDADGGVSLVDGYAKELQR